MSVLTRLSNRNPLLQFGLALLVFPIFGALGGWAWFKFQQPVTGIVNRDGELVVPGYDLGKVTESDLVFVLVGFLLMGIAGLLMTQQRGRQLEFFVLGIFASWGSAVLAKKIGMSLGAAASELSVGSKGNLPLTLTTDLLEFQWVAAFVTGFFLFLMINSLSNSEVEVRND